MFKNLYLIVAVALTLWFGNLKAQEEIKKNEPEKTEAIKPEQMTDEQKQLLAKEQEKASIETARNFFKLIKNKKVNEATKLLSIPFIYDEQILLDKNEIIKLFTAASSTESENLFFELPVFTLHKKQKGFTDNNILINMQERNAEEDSHNILILFDRDSLKIIGVFLNLDENNRVINEKIKAKENDKKSTDEEK